MNTDLSLWLKPYFYPTCHRILDDYFISLGFMASKDQGTTITYFNETVYLDFEYWVEDSPEYVLMIGIGFWSKNSGKKVRDGIGLWYTMPQNEKLTNWYYRSEQQLEDVLIKIRDHILDMYAKPLWEDPCLLREAIISYHEENKKG
jgi:hypothetical protein